MTQTTQTDDVAKSETMQVHLVHDRMGTRYNRPNATVKITANDYVVNTTNGTERFSRENHTLVAPEI